MNDDLNHYARRVDIDTALITGDTITGLCGETFVPELEVGSSGSSEDPTLPICPVCEVILEAAQVAWEAERQAACA